MYYLKQLFPLSYNSRFIENGKMIYNKNIKNFFKLIIIKKFTKRRNNGRNKKIGF